MRLSNFASLTLLAAFLFLGGGCGWWNTATEPANREAVPPQSDLPYPAKEPERFQATVLITTGPIERRVAFARDGERLRIDFDAGTESGLTLMETGTRYVLSTANMNYAEVGPAENVPIDAFVTDLTERLLHRKMYTEFESLGLENGLEKFRATIRSNAKHESLVYVDPELGMPVIHEFYSVEGETRTLEYRMALTDVRRDVDPAVFQIPQEYKKVSVAEFYKKLREPKQ